MSTSSPSTEPVEPVPDGSGLLTLPFLSAVAGLFQSYTTRAYRVTLHRAMTRSGQKYLQQVAPYAEDSGPMTTGEGRIFPVDLRIMGSAFTSGKVWRTKRYSDPKQFERDLAADMMATNDARPLSAVARSWLAVPFVVPAHGPALVLFAESQEFNFFADDERVGRVIGMCSGFARLLDSLHSNPISAVRNYPLGPAGDMKGNDKAYPTIHEALDSSASPQLNFLKSFNFEILGP